MPPSATRSACEKASASSKSWSVQWHWKLHAGHICRLLCSVCTPFTAAPTPQQLLHPERLCEYQKVCVSFTPQPETAKCCDDKQFQYPTGTAISRALCLCTTDPYGEHQRRWPLALTLQTGAMGEPSLCLVAITDCAPECRCYTTEASTCCWIASAWQPMACVLPGQTKEPILNTQAQGTDHKCHCYEHIVRSNGHLNVHLEWDAGPIKCLYSDTAADNNL